MESLRDCRDAVSGVQFGLSTLLATDNSQVLQEWQEQSRRRGSDYVQGFSQVHRRNRFVQEIREQIRDRKISGKWNTVLDF